MRSIHAAEVKFNTHVICSALCLWKKNFVFKFASMKNDFFCTMHRPARESNAALDLTRHCTRFHAFALTRIQVLNAFHSALQSLTFFFIFDFCESRKKFIFHTCELKYKNFFFKLKAESLLHICVKLYSSRVCITHRNFQLFIKFLLKISFFATFLYVVWITKNYRYFPTIHKIFTQLSPT